MEPSNITEEQFNAISDGIVEMWKPLAKLHGAELTVEKRWDDPTVNAYAQQSGKSWVITMFGGLARRPEVSLDGFALVVCHELGHHFGGYPFYNGDWAATEGESDYFATQVCARRIWKKSLRTNARAQDAAPRRLLGICDKNWSTPEDQALCTRIAFGGLSLAKLLGALGRDKEPSLDAKDQTIVTQTVPSHPAAQCRLDTFLHGALCSVNSDLKVIPGKSGEVGHNTIESELAAGKYSCLQNPEHNVGYRPRCWFGPLTKTSFRPLLASSLLQDAGMSFHSDHEEQDSWQ